MGQRYPGAFPAWTGPTDAQLVATHPSTSKAILSGSGTVCRTFPNPDLLKAGSLPILSYFAIINE